MTTRVPCAEFFAARDRALLAHATQVDPEGSWFKMPRDLERSVWPTEDFEAALSYVPIIEVEDDLFAGLPSVVEADEMATRQGLTLVFDGRVAV